jgi:predicted transposase YbfD/YdcC
VRTKLPARLDEKWPGIKAICRIERIRETKDRCSREVIYAITSAPPEAFDASALLNASRDHWAIENREFHVRDVTFREDASRIRTGGAPEAMAVLRSSTLGLIRRTGQKPTAARPAYAARPKKAIELLMGA